MEYEWIGYDITGEIVCGGIISAYTDDEAEAKVEKELEENNDEYTEAGYFNHKIVKVK